MRVEIRYHTAAGHVLEAAAELTVEDSFLEERDRLYTLGNRARAILRDFGLEPGWTPAPDQSFPPEGRDAPTSEAPGRTAAEWAAERVEVLGRLEAIETWRRETLGG